MLSEQSLRNTIAPNHVAPPSLNSHERTVSHSVSPRALGEVPCMLLIQMGTNPCTPHTDRTSLPLGCPPPPCHNTYWLDKRQREQQSLPPAQPSCLSTALMRKLTGKLIERPALFESPTSPNNSEQRYADWLVKVCDYAQEMTNNRLDWPYGLWSPVGVQLGETQRPCATQFHTRTLLQVGVQLSCKRW